MSATVDDFVNEPLTCERRDTVRFPIEQEVRYKVFGRNNAQPGHGKTVNMSSSGVLFTTSVAVRTGDRLEVSVNWPAQLDNKCPLKIVMTGRAVRVGESSAAIVIDHYEFRTQGANRLN